MSAAGAIGMESHRWVCPVGGCGWVYEHAAPILHADVLADVFGTGTMAAAARTQQHWETEQRITGHVDGHGKLQLATIALRLRVRVAELEDDLRLSRSRADQYEHEAADPLAARAAIGRVRAAVAELEREADARCGGDMIQVGGVSGLVMAITRIRTALDAAGPPPTPAPTCGPCGGTRWVDDENWSPEYPELWRGERSPGDGLIPCGTCSFGDWNAPWPAPGGETTDV